MMDHTDWRAARRSAFMRQFRELPGSATLTASAMSLVLLLFGLSFAAAHHWLFAGVCLLVSLACSWFTFVGFRELWRMAGEKAREGSSHGD